MVWLRLHNFFLSFFVSSVLVIGCGKPGGKDGSSSQFYNHFSTITNSITDNYGKEKTAMWLANWNIESNDYPFDFSHSDEIPCRVYLDRSVDAPGGSTLYWDLPNIVAAVELSKSTGNMDFEKAAKSYTQEYLEKNTSNNGIILWGNHYYYDVIHDNTVRFKSSESPKPVNFNTENGDLHEMRPILPPWELLYRWFPSKIDKHIRQVAQNHLVDIGTGEFNRHANSTSEYAFLESGSILVNSLAFLYSKTLDEELLNMADAILNFSFSNRHPQTGLVKNSPSMKRWDQSTSTTEIGLWASNVLKATKYLPEDYKNKWIKIATRAIRPWLENGFDAEAKMFFGALNIIDAKHIIKTDDYSYKPGTYCSIWNPLFPRHDYPMQFAECCLSLYKLTDEEIYRNACDNWISTITNQLEARNKRFLYAENYARVCHFLLGYAIEFDDKKAYSLAKSLMSEAISSLYLSEANIFRGHTGEFRYDAVDGIGLLYFPYIWLETGNFPANSSDFF